MKFSKSTVAIGVIFLVLLADQILKIWVKTHMMLGDFKEITPWFYIWFTENNGMAYGIEVFSKLFLTLFRIVAVGAIGYYLWKIVRKNYATGYIVCIALILAGALGNIIDSVFYGVIFDHSKFQVATLFPPGGGYASWFHGKVVDMFYFPLFRFIWPEWMPFVGGNEFLFFRPIFNLADSAITVGVILLLLFYRKYLSSRHPDRQDAKE